MNNNVKTKPNRSLNSCDIEIAIARHFNPRINLIVPNVFWGLGFSYELDLIILTQSEYASEVEIKTTISDLKAERLKRKTAHCSNKIRRLYFAVPETMSLQALDLIPEKAGLFSVGKNFKVTLIKAPKINMLAHKLSEKEIKKLHKLAAMRIWNLKEALLKSKQRNYNGQKE